jgi:AcrR family transcriptional regulator
MTQRSEPRSRRERPAKPALTRAGIIATAVRLVRTEGLDRITMRRLAQELDTGPASLYVYLRNTTELHAAVFDELLGTVDLAPVCADGDWRERLIRVLTSYTHLMFEYPGLAQAALVARPSGPNYLALAEGLLALMSEGGVASKQAAWGLDLLLLFATATAAEHTTRDRDVDAPGEEAAQVATVLNAAPDTYPYIAALGADLISGPGETRLAWGFQVLIDGTIHIRTPDSPPHSPARSSKNPIATMGSDRGGE